MASSKAAVWMTIAAAAGTLAVAVAVIAGPSILQCSSSADGLLACLRQQVVEAGLLPTPAETETPDAAPQVDAEPAPAPEVPAPTAPDVNLVRAEPDGHVIVAGTAAPGIEVEVFANGDLVGKAMAEASGDWVVVPDRPLAVGTATISVGASGSNARSPHTFTVVIPEDRTSAPVITASEPQPAPKPEAAREPEPKAPPVADLPEPAAAPALKPVEAPPSRQAVSEPEPVQAPPPSPAAAVEAPPAEPSLQMAEADPADSPQPEPPATSVPAQPATIDAIEIDGAANYFAGAGPEGATVQLYVEDRFVASARVEGGRWLVEARGVLALPVQRVRIDLIGPQQATVAARAEVDFVIDVPPPTPEIAVSGTGAGGVASPATAAAELDIRPQVELEREVDPAIPTLHALPSADPKMLRFASGKAIIRRGETLWAIAERVYGDGSQYRRIVEANGTLISSPGRIFPGQVFDLPKLQDRPAAN